MYSIKQNGIQEKFLKIGIMALVAIATIGIGMANANRVLADDSGGIQNHFGDNHEGDEHSESLDVIRISTGVIQIDLLYHSFYWQEVLSTLGNLGNGITGSSSSSSRFHPAAERIRGPLELGIYAMAEASVLLSVPRHPRLLKGER